VKQGNPPRPTPPPERALADLLGLASRARGLIHGTDMTRKAVRDGEVRLVLLAGDGSPTQAQKLVPLLEARGVPFHVCLSREALGVAIGRGPVSAVGITNESFAKRAAELAAQLASPQG
jgi:ribosomal protein L7Ae-like RNA K-turn-binding protein